MAIQKQSYQIMGMRQDNLVGTNSSNKFAHEIMNLRLNTVGDYTTAAWTTEEGTKLKPVIWDEATDQDALDRLNTAREQGCIPIGQAVINDQWIVFCTRPDAPDGSRDIIFKYWYKEETDDLYGTILYIGTLGFDVNHPIETLTYFENEQIQKVYWTDGLNQPRMINIVNVKMSHDLDTQFDFVQEVNLKEQVTITKDTSGAGLFPPCTVKYALTYYQKYGQETNVVYDSPLYYPIKGDRACGPDELSGDSFNIKVTGLDLDHGFDYIRLYSIVRTTEDATPIVRIVADKPLVDLPEENGEKYVLFVDTNTTGEIVDPTVLQYVGGKVITAETFSQKDNTLFLGNITLKTQSVKGVLSEPVAPISSITFLDLLRDRGTDPNSPVVKFALNPDGETPKKILGLRVNADGNDYSTYQYTNQMNESDIWDQGVYKKYNGNSQKIKIFKYREWYRFGIQFQDTYGTWSDVIFLDDAQNMARPYTDEWNPLCQLAMAYYILKAPIRKHLVEHGYIKARLVCCFETNADRSVLAQGVICPTVYNQEWRSNNAPHVLSSWFFRPNEHLDEFNVTKLPWKDDEEIDKLIYGGPDGGAKRYWYSIVPEVQSTSHGNYDYILTTNNASQFRVDRKLLTFHSADLEFDESLQTIPNNGVDINVVGLVPVNSFASSLYLDADQPSALYSGNRGRGLVGGKHIQGLRIWGDFTTNIGTHLTIPGEWDDANVYTRNGKGQEFLPFVIYPFHRNGSLNNYVKDISDWEIPKYWVASKPGDVDWPIRQTSRLHSKVLSHILYSTTAIFADEYPLNQKGFEIFNSTETLPLQLNGKIYYGNVNSIAPVHRFPGNEGEYYLMPNVTGSDPDYPGDGSYPLAYYKDRGRGRVKFGTTGSFVDNDNDSKTEGIFCSDPVPITFKSTIHGVFESNALVGQNGLDAQSSWTNLTARPFMWLAEIRRPSTEETRFGGPSNPNNVYIPCGPAVDLRVEANSPYTDMYLYGWEGDHYYMRYDCLKTYPFTTSDANQIVEILSFMCETRINLDGRYDKNRGLLDNTTISTTNFNYINKSYTQSNNFFTFTTLDDLSASLDRFPNQITWTKTKTSGEDVDAWTNITLASVADAEGNIGQITRIVNLNDSLYLFQDHGVARIGYNEKTALSVENGVPLEIANSGKYTGLNYMSKEVGCQNKWSISSTKNGVFFIDDARQELMTLSENLQSLSSMHGFDAFLIQQLPASEHFKPWTPLDQTNFVTYYDRLGNDVFYINKDYCLAWNEQTKTFTSFYSYNGVPYMANIGTHLLMWDINTPLVFDMQEGTRQVSTTETRTVTQYVEEEYEEEIQEEVPVTVPRPFTDEEYLIFRWKASPNYTSTTTSNNVQRKHLTKSDIIHKFARVVPVPLQYAQQDWNAHLIISLEFYKSGEPFIIQLEVQGKHFEPDGNNDYWETDPLPRIYFRTSSNVTEQEFQNLKFAVGGFSQPTIEFGNFVYRSQRWEARLANGTWLTQPWADVDDTYIDEDGEEVLCVTKLYDLNKNTDNPISHFMDQGNPFNGGIRDNAAQVDSSEYSGETETYYEIVTRTVTKTRTVPVEVEVSETVTKDVPSYTIKSSTSNIWAARENPNHCEFFGTYQPYWITLVCDGASSENYAFPADKVFNVIEYRADVFNRRSTTPRPDINLPVFDKIAAYNGYQIYKEFPINSIRKFEIWRAQLPRATYMDSNHNLYTNRDRIRNPFCYIKLMNTVPETLTGSNRMILHDLAVYYDMK